MGDYLWYSHGTLEGNPSYHGTYNTSNGTTLGLRSSHGTSLVLPLDFRGTLAFVCGAALVLSWDFRATSIAIFPWKCPMGLEETTKSTRYRTG